MSSDIEKIFIKAWNKYADECSWRKIYKVDAIELSFFIFQT